MRTTGTTGNDISSGSSTATTTTTDQSQTVLDTDTSTDASTEVDTGNNILGSYATATTDLATDTDSNTTTNLSLTITSGSTTTAQSTGSASGNSILGDYTQTSQETDTATGTDSGTAGTRTFNDTNSSSSTITTTDTGNSVNQTDTITSTETDGSTVTTTDTYTPGGSDTQTVTSGSTLTAYSFSNAATGDFTTSNVGTSTQTTAETGSDSNTYTLAATASSDTSSNENGNATLGDYTLTTSSTDTSSSTRTGTDTSGNAFAITQADNDSGTVNTTGNNLTGDYTATAIGTDTLTTDEQISGTGNSSTLHQVVSGSSTLTNTGNDFTGDFSTTNNEQNTTTLIQSGYNASGTYSLNESMSDSPTIIDTGNNINGTAHTTQTGEQTYSLYQSNTSGSDNYTLTGTGDKPYTITGTDNANTGVSDTTETGTDNYSLTQSGVSSGSSFSLALTGSDGYTTDNTINSQTGAFDTSTTGSGTYTKTGTGPGSGTTSFSSTEIGSTRDADVVLTTSGTSRYDLLAGFNNTSDGGNGTAGIADYSPVGLPVMVGRASVPAGIFSSLGDARYEYCFAAGTKIRLADHPPRNIEEMEEQLRLPAVRDTDPEGKPEPCHVLKVFRNAPAPIWHVRVGGDTIRTTANHPFYAQGKGWTQAAKLQPGDQLRTFDGGWVAVESVSDSGVIEPVFNLQVERNHTYFIEISQGTAILVHNESVAEMQQEAVRRSRFSDLPRKTAIRLGVLVYLQKKEIAQLLEKANYDASKLIGYSEEEYMHDHEAVNAAIAKLQAISDLFSRLGLDQVNMHGEYLRGGGDVGVTSGKGIDAAAHNAALLLNDHSQSVQPEYPIESAVVVGGAFKIAGMVLGDLGIVGIGGRAGAEGAGAGEGGAAGIAEDTNPVQVTSWAKKGVTPDLNPTRWVQIGRATVWNYIKTGLWGGKFSWASEFPFLKWASSGVPISNYITDFIKQSELMWPEGWEWIKGFLGQRIIK